METVKDKVERYRLKAEIFLDENIPAFIITINGDWNFCSIQKVNKHSIEVSHFAGKREGQTQRIIFIDIIQFDEYQEATSK